MKAATKPAPTLKQSALRSTAENRPKAPDNTRPQIVAAAAIEFAAKGLAGARVDAIAEASGCNKAMLYYFFKSKEDLYLEVLEDAYADMRQRERELDLSHFAPVVAIRRLVEFKFDYVSSHPLLISLLSGENLNEARHLKRSKRLRSMHSPLVETLTGLLKAGVAEGTMRPGIDPVQLYISIASLSYFYFSNAATLAEAFDRDLLTPAAKAQRRRHAVDVILHYLLVTPAAAIAR